MHNQTMGAWGLQSQLNGLGLAGGSQNAMVGYGSMAGAQARACRDQYMGRAYEPTTRVSARRAADAYRKALTAIDLFAETNAATIKAIDDEAHATFLAQHEVYTAAMTKREELREQFDGMNNEIERLAAIKQSFWGWNKAQKDAYEALLVQQVDVRRAIDSMPSRPVRGFKAAPRIAAARDLALANFAFADLSLDALSLKRSAIVELHRMETEADAWLLEKDDFRAIIDKDFRAELAMTSAISVTDSFEAEWQRQDSIIFSMYE